MKKQSNIYLIFLNILIAVYVLYIIFSITKNKTLLIDDLSKMYASKHISKSYFSFKRLSVLIHNPVILAITSLSNSFSSKYLLFNL